MDGSSVEVMKAAWAEAVEVGGEEALCRADEVCDVTSSVSEDEMYGGIQHENVIKVCKVKIYNNRHVKMVNVKMDQSCDAPLPKYHKFSR